jgi:DNA-binding CsgD family transcriptional regulator
VARQAAARRLQISIRSVDQHLEAVYRKLGVNSHVEVACSPVGIPAPTHVRG